jgi:hypothetical protein
VRVFFLLTIALAADAAPASEPPVSADEIMARVAVNQDLAQHARATFIYRQNIAIRLRDTHGKLLREEISDYHVTPDADRTRKELVNFKGRYWKSGSMVSYDKSGEGQDEGFRNEADGDLASDLREDLTGDAKSKDGLALELFPLTAKEQHKYRFVVKGEERYQGTEVYRIAFEPNRGAGDATCWKGEALVSKSDYEPLLITTKLAFKIPFLVRTALDTNLQGLGFSVQYRKFDDGVWFPVSYGTEFRVHVLFVYSRLVTVSMVNSDFRRADVKSSVEFDTVQ